MSHYRDPRSVQLRLEQTLAAVAGLPELEGVYVAPALRELLEQIRK